MLFSCSLNITCTVRHSVHKTHPCRELGWLAVVLWLIGATNRSCRLPMTTHCSTKVSTYAPSASASFKIFLIQLSHCIQLQLMQAAIVFIFIIVVYYHLRATWVCFVTGTAADLSLAMFLWEAVSSGAAVANRRCFLAIFDINRWYNAQMPNCIRYPLSCAVSCMPFESFSSILVFSFEVKQVTCSIGRMLISRS